MSVDVETQPLASGPWRTDTFRRLERRLSAVLGDKTAKAFDALKLVTVDDLVHHLPRRYFSGTELSDLSVLQNGEEVAVLAEVVEAKAHHVDIRSGRTPRLEAVITDRRGSLTLAFFGKPQLIKHWQGQLAPGARGIFAGKVRLFHQKLQLAHPDFVILDPSGHVVAGAKRNEGLADATQGSLVSLYPSAAKLPTWTISTCVALALASLEGTADPLPEDIREAAGVIGLTEALLAVHQPKQLEGVKQGRDRLRFDEAFALQLTMAYRRADAAAYAAVPRAPRDDGLLATFEGRLPFTLTEGQVRIGAEIAADLTRTRPMQRLLQGEVGSGKTLVALLAMLQVIDSGGQAALLAPTEVLATQHHHTLTRLLGELGQGGGLLAGDGPATSLALITGSMTAARRREALARVASGEAGLVIGTHALLGEQVAFADLGLVVVDEQHRFGVEQRAALTARAVARPHVLVMTATPIPRSVAMTVFGDLEISTLDEVPAGRADVSTVVVDAIARPDWVSRAWQRVREEAEAGRQTFIVCPRITHQEPDPGRRTAAADESEEELPPAIAVEDLYAELSTGPLRDVAVEVLHGQLPTDDKDATMARFVAGETAVLVATTVIEVGVDVPNASMMVICDADRFGISQLHQLRGRIGRGAHPGVCLLHTRAAPPTRARERLAAVARTRDGFALADVDLEQRREGDVLGASQAGHRSSLKLLRVLADADLISEARELAERCVIRDPRRDDPRLADLVARLEADAAGEWLERS